MFKDILVSIKKVFGSTISKTFKTLSSDELDSIKIGLVSSILASKGIPPDESILVATQIVGLVDSVGNDIAEVADEVSKG